MAWKALTATDVKTKLSGPELTALQSSALASGQTDPLTEIITQVIDEIRGYIAAGGFSLEEGEKVPSKLVSCALSIIRYRLATRLPIKSFLDENRKSENEQALTLLSRVADGKFMIEDPVTAEDETSGARTPSMTAKTRVFTSTDEDGI